MKEYGFKEILMIHFCERIGIDIADVNVSNPKSHNDEL